MTLRLRPAVPNDCYALWVWANDPAARAASGDRAPIPWEAHLGWFAARLADPASRIMIGETITGQPVGVVRFESDTGWQTARVSYAIAAEYRRRGAGESLLGLGLVAIRASFPGVHLNAQVRDDNIGSLRIFRRGNWRERPGATGWIEFANPGVTP